MEQIIDDMLALAREGQVATDLELLSLSTTAEDVWADFDPDEATLVVTGDRELQADYGALCEIFENLYRNALEHAGDDVTVTAGPLDDGFFVADDGPGIPADERAQVFEYGYTTDRDGTGYGLPIVERIADAHGWSVQVAESADAGARFEITGVE
jgi:signal transduction histidine kinase